MHEQPNKRTNEQTNELIVQTIYRDTFNTTVSKQHFDRHHIDFKHTVEPKNESINDAKERQKSR